MKKVTLSLFIFLFSFSFTFAQEKDKTQEIGIITSDFSNFGITYRIGQGNSIWRFNALSTNLGKEESTSGNNNVDQTNFGAGFQLGKEWRHQVADKFEFRYGLDLGYSYAYSKTDNQTNMPIQETTRNTRNVSEVGINGVLGFNFLLRDNFILGGELLPAVYYRNIRQEQLIVGGNTLSESDTNQYGFNLNSSSIRLSFVYRF